MKEGREKKRRIKGEKERDEIKKGESKKREKE